MDEPIPVLIIEARPVLRFGLVGYVGSQLGLRVAGSTGIAAEGYRLAAALAPAVALVGTNLPDAPGLTAPGELRRRSPATATIVVSRDASDDELFAAIRVGAAAYVSPDIPESELATIIKRVAAGDYVINEQLLGKPSVVARLIERFRGASESELVQGGAFVPLTDREVEILTKVSDGLTNAEIGLALGISPQTVKNHLTSIMRKLAVNDRTQAVIVAMRRGWLAFTAEQTPPGSLARRIGR